LFSFYNPNYLDAVLNTENRYAAFYLYATSNLLLPCLRAAALTSPDKDKVFYLSA